MKVFDKVLEVTGNNEDLSAKAMLVVESYIFNEILEMDAITKWEEIFRATQENREIKFVPYKKTELPTMIKESDYIKQAAEQKCEMITQEIFDNMEIEKFEHFVMDIDYMLLEAKKLTI